MTGRTREGPLQAANPMGDAADGACLVTGSPRLAGAIARYVGKDQLTVKHRLADVLKEAKCRVVIVDTRVEDIDIWPGPLLVQPQASQKSWLFLVGSLRDVASLQTLPPDCTFLERGKAHLPAIASFITKRLDPHSVTRIEDVSWMAEDRTFIVKLANGRTYALPLASLAEEDASDLRSVSVGRNRHYFSIRQASGNKLEVPWDDILYHCEPEYEYYKGREDRNERRASAIRIGHAVRNLRNQRGLSITQLAHRAHMQRPNLSRLEAGKHLPNLETLERIASALDVPVAQLITRLDSTPLPQSG